MVMWANRAILAATALSLPLAAGSVLPLIHRENDTLPGSADPFAEFGTHPNAKRADQSFQLRILSLGASIMSGTGSTTGDGSRKPLRDALRQDGWDVDMVGSLHGGTMVDYEHEAVPGDVISQVLARVPHSTPYKPNIVNINAGTNDANDPVDPSTAGQRMNSVLDAIWGADGMSDTCVMLSTLIPTTNANGEANQGTINDQYRALVTQRAGEGNCIYLAEMWPNGEQWFDFDTDYLATESPHVHPNDVGHAKMAAVFYKAINQAIADNRLAAPGEFSTGKTVCDKYAGSGVDAGGLTQRGSGYDDGIYYHDSEAMGVIWTANSQWDRNQWKFARLFDRNYDDLLAWISDSDTSQHYAVWANSADGKASFTQMSDLDGDLNCEYTDGVNFIDMNSDGLDDLVYIDADGNAYLSINQGDGDRAAGKSPTFKRVSDTAMIMPTKGYPRDQVVLADIDGDGRGDYGYVDGSGNVWFWRNGWIDDIPQYWQALGQRFTGTGLGDAVGTRFEDINGDGRDDWLLIDESGVGYIYTNSRSCLKGVEGNGLNVAWREGFYTGESSGPAYKGMGAYVTDTEKNLRNRIHFARIYGDSTVFGNLPLQDYVFMEHTAESDGTHTFQMRVWKNTGGGATKLLADGDRYCNMMGHANGMVDYVWIWSVGKMELWENRGKGTISDSDPDGYWDYQGTIWTPPENLNRRDLHLADWNGDGYCDIIYANPDGGAVQVWINNYGTAGTWDWTYESNPAPILTCAETRGLAIFDLAVRFADITGNGRTDYLCIQPDSTTTGFVQASDGSWSDVGQIKVSISKDRANLRWADVNGDGADDLLWIEKFSGDAYVWYDAGPGNPADLLGSSYAWTEQGISTADKAYAGNAAGTCEYWHDLDGNGIADEHYILGTFNNEARTSLAPSCGLSDKTGDDPTFDGPLPTVPGDDSSSSGSSGSSGDGSGDDGSGDDGSGDDGSGGFGIGSKGTTVDDGANTNGWRNVSCSYGTLTDTTNDPTQQFIDSKASDAYADCWNAYTKNNHSLTWTNFMVDYFHAAPGINCESVTSADCNTNIECGESDTANAAVSSPGGYYIINSMVWYHIQFNNFYQGIINAVALMGGDIGTFSSTFAPQLDEMKDSKVMLDVIQLAFSVFSAGAFNSWLKNIPLFKQNPNSLGVGKDVTNAIMSNSLGITKDTMSAVDDLAAQNTISSYMSHIATNWEVEVSNLCENTFGSPELLYRAIVNGGTWDPNEDSNALDVTWDLELAMYSYLIPVAWNISASDVSPFIATAEGLGHKGSDACSGYNGNKLSEQETIIYFESGVLSSAALVCIDDTPYWLVGMKKSTEDRDEICDSSAAAPGVCASGVGPHVKSLPGIDTLDGSQFGNLTVVDIVTSALRAYSNNGNANGWATSDPTTVDGMEDISDNGINALGMVNIPICSFEEAASNAYPSDSSANYPCN